MDENKEIKFQDKTRGGYEYVVHTKEGKNDEYPIIGEVKCECPGYWTLACWKREGLCALDDETDKFELVPAIPLPLESKKVGDKVYTYSFDWGRVLGYEIIERNTVTEDAWFAQYGSIVLLVDDSGAPVHVGTKQQLFFATEEEALESIRESSKHE